MKIRREKQARMTLVEFAEKHHLTLQVVERSPRIVKSMSIHPFYANFREADHAEGGCSVGKHGNGQTEEEAIADFADIVSESEMWVPKATDTPYDRHRVFAPIITGVGEVPA